MKLNKNTKLYNTIITALVVILAVSIVLSFTLGRYPIPFSDLVSCIGYKIKELFVNIGNALSSVFPSLFSRHELAPYGDMTTMRVLFNIRLPRILLACLVGCSLSAAGASYQGVFQNPMAAPDILGASSGAAFGAAMAILLNWGSQGIMLSAFFFSLITVIAVVFISERAKGKRVLSLILAGIMVSSLFSAGTSFIKLVADPADQLPAITYWLMGSLASATNKDLLFAFIPMAVGLVPLFLLRWKINVLTLGDDEARTIGINAKQLRLITILCSTLITAASVSVSGMIGFVGLVIPHLCRRLVGNNYKHLMPATMLMGAVFLLIVDDVSRNLLSTEIPIGILTSFIGAPFFIYLITREDERF